MRTDPPNPFPNPVVPQVLLTDSDGRERKQEQQGDDDYVLNVNLSAAENGPKAVQSTEARYLLVW